MSQQPRPARRRLGDILIEEGLITREQLSDALDYQKLWGHRLGTALVAKRSLSEHDLIRVLGRELGLDTADPAEMAIPRDVLALVHKDLAAKHDLIPVAVEELNGVRRLVVAMIDPFNIEAITEVRRRSRLDVRAVVASMSSVARAIHLNYGVMSAASRLPAFADAEMVVVHRGGDEAKFGRGVSNRHASNPHAGTADIFADNTSPGAEPTTDVRNRPGMTDHTTQRQGIPSYPMQGVPMQGVASVPQTPPAPGFMPQYPPQMQGYPQIPPMMPAGYAVAPYQQPPYGVAPAMATQMTAVGGRLQSPADPLQGVAATELVQALVRVLVRRGYLTLEELAAELRR